MFPLTPLALIDTNYLFLFNVRNTIQKVIGISFQFANINTFIVQFVLKLIASSLILIIEGYVHPIVKTIYGQWGSTLYFCSSLIYF